MIKAQCNLNKMFKIFGKRCLATSTEKVNIHKFLYMSHSERRLLMIFISNTREKWFHLRVGPCPCNTTVSVSWLHTCIHANPLPSLMCPICSKRTGMEKTRCDLRNDWWWEISRVWRRGLLRSHFLRHKKAGSWTIPSSIERRMDHSTLSQTPDAQTRI